MALGKKHRRCTGLIKARVLEGLKLGGCPICRLLRRTEERFIENILYEEVNDQEIREELGRTLGLCPYHAWMLVRIASRPGVLNGLGATIIYEDMLSEHLQGRETEDAECLVCRHIQGFEDIFIEGYAACFDEDEDILEDYASASSMLCSTHLDAVFSRMMNKEARERLRVIQRGKVEKLLADMRAYIRKSSYDSPEHPSLEEAAAWIRAVEFLKGYDTSRAIFRACIPRSR